MSNRPIRRYFKWAEHFRHKARDPDIAKYDVLDEEADSQAESDVIKERRLHLSLLEDRWAHLIPVSTTKNPSISVVYFLKVDDVIKIATAVRWDKRLRAVATAADISEIQLLHATPGGLQKLREFHRRFSHLRIDDHWFEADDEIIEFTRRAHITSEQPDEEIDESG